MKLKLILPLTTLLAACGVANNSTTNDISTPGAPDNENILVWTDGSSIHVGDCEVDQLPTRDHCATRGALSYRQIKELNERLFSDELEKITQDRAAEVSRLRLSHSSIVSMDRNIATLESQLKTKQEQKESQTEQLNQAKDELENDVQPRIDDYAAQLRRVFERLANDPDNAMLVRLRNDLETEKSQLDQKKSQLSSKIASLDEAILTLDADIANLQNDLATKKEERETTFTALELESNATRQLDGKKADLESVQAATASVLELIEDQNLSYRSSLLSSQQVQALKRIVAAYESIRTGTAPSLDMDYDIQLWDFEDGRQELGRFTITAKDGDKDDIKSKILIKLGSVQSESVLNTDGASVNGVLYNIVSDDSYDNERLAETIAAKIVGQ